MNYQKTMWKIFKASILLSSFNCLLIGTVLAQPTSRGATISATIDTSKKGNTWAVIVGISKYQNLQGLNYADKDALAFYDYLVNKKVIDKEHIQVLTNEKAIASDIYGALDWLDLSVKENDRVIFYFSGHGDVETKTIHQNGFLLANDAPIAAYMTKGTISVNYLQDYLETYVAKRKVKDVLLIVDACRAGKLAGGTEGIQITMHALGQNWNNQIIKILSAQEGESSFEDKKWGGGRGVFSYYLVKGLEGLANRNADSVITTSELAAYLPFAVGDATNSIQNPTVSGNPKTNLFAFNKDLLALANTQETQSQTGQLLAARGTNDELDPEIANWYNQYRNYLQKGRLIWGEKQTDTINCAKYYYLKLVKDARAKTILPSLKSSFIASLKHKTEIYLENYLTDNVHKNDDLSEEYKEISYAKSLIDSSNILYNYIKTRAYFMQATVSGNAKSDIQLLKKIIQIESDAAYAYNALGRRFDLQLDNQDSAIYYYKRALALSPKWSYTYIRLGETNVEKGNYKEAVNYFEKARKLDSTSHAIYFYLADVYNLLYHNHKMGDSINTIGIEINKALFEKDTTKSMLLSNIGWLYRNKRNEKKAMSYFKYAFKINENDIIAVEGLANGNERIGNFEESIKYWKIALQLDPQFIDLYLFIGTEYEKLNKFNDAIKYIQMAIDHKPFVNEYYDALVNAYLYKLDFRNALKTSDILLKIHPEKPENHFQKWKVYLQMKNYSKANAYYNKVISGNKLNQNQYKKIEDFFYYQKDYKNYIKVSMIGIKAYPQEIQNYYDVACVFALSKDFNNSLKYLNIAFNMGYNNFENMVTDYDLTNIRQLPEFKQLIKKYFPDKVK